MTKEALREPSGNVLDDLGSPSQTPPAPWAMHAQLMATLRESITKAGWIQAQATERLGSGSSRVSGLKRNKDDTSGRAMPMTVGTQGGQRVERAVGCASRRIDRGG